MSLLSTWLATKKRRKETRRLMALLIGGIKRRVAFEREIWQAFAEFCNTDFAPIWAEYAVELGKHAESLPIEEKKQAHLNYLLRDQKG